MSGSRRLAISLAFAALVVFAAATLAYVRTSAPVDVRPLTTGELGPRVLVVVPHPDDEVLGAGGTIHQLVRGGARVKVVIVTAGDAYERAARRLASGPPDASRYLRLGETRHAESVRAAAALGVPAPDVVSLGYADGSLDTVWDRDWDRAHPYVGRNGSPTVPYTWAYRPGAEQCGQGVTRDLAAIVAEFEPSSVITVDPNETHPDHRACAAFVRYALDTTGYDGALYTFLVHFGHYPFPWAYLPGMELSPPEALRGNDIGWRTLELADVDVRTKSLAIDEYRSQTAVPDLAWFMRSFIRRNELFGTQGPGTAAMSDSDERPAPGASGTVVATPRGNGMQSALRSSAGIADVRLVRGPGIVWIGIRTFGRVSSTTTYRAGMRIFGGGRAPCRLEVTVAGGVASVGTPSDDCIEPAGVRAAADGDTMWIAVPASAFEGRDRCLLGATARPAGTRTTYRTPWRDARL